MVMVMMVVMVMIPFVTISSGVGAQVETLQFAGQLGDESQVD